MDRNHVSPVASRIIAKFRTPEQRGTARIAKGLNLDESSVYRWTWPRKRKGTGGLVPTNYQPLLIELAACEKIPLGPDDFFDMPSPHPLPEHPEPDGVVS